MLNFEMRYGGNKYNTIEDAMQQMITDQVGDKVREAIEPFEEELDQHGAEVVIDVPADFTDIKITITNVPDELRDEVNQAVRDYFAN